MNLSKIDQAIVFAAKAHQGQTRKINDIPYISHPYSVGMLLSQTGCTDEVIIAGILHDTVEDTVVTLEDIKEQFGGEVADLVAGASEPDKSLSWEERKQHTLNVLQKADFNVCLVVCADKCHNAQSLLDASNRLGTQLWSHFHRGKEKQSWYYRSILKILKERLGRHPLIEILEKTVHELFT